MAANDDVVQDLIRSDETIMQSSWLTLHTLSILFVSLNPQKLLGRPPVCIFWILWKTREFLLGFGGEWNNYLMYLKI